jgi:hypothetical protein
MGNPRTADQLDNRSVDTGRLFTEETYSRLREIKSRYDPGNVIQANHEIPPAA